MDTATLATMIKAQRYGYYGIRVIEADDLPVVGRAAAPSHVWDDEGQWTDELMDGCSALQVGGWDTVDLIVERSTYYGGNVVLLLGSDSADEGQDHGEIIMRNAVVLAAWMRDDA